MPYGSVVVITLLVAATCSPAAHATNTRAYRMWRHRMFIAAYDDLVAKLNVFANAWDGSEGSEFPVIEARGVRKAWKKFTDLEPWFRTSAETEAAEVCSTVPDSETAFRSSYKTLVSALNSFLTHYAAGNALTFSATDAAAVRQGWRCLVQVAPAFGRDH